MTEAKDVALTGSGTCTYRWIEDWATLPSAETARSGWAHPGMAVTPGGEIATCHPALPLIMFLRPDGTCARSFRVDATEAHGIAAHGDSVWIADNGAKRLAGPGYPPHTAPKGGQVLECAPDGTVRRRFGSPPHPVYGEGKFSPTSVAVTDDGEIWIADGYGQSLVHRYGGDGGYVQTISGEEGSAGAFKTPHSVWIDVRKTEPELYVADRSNARIQVYDLDGRFKRCIGPAAQGGALNSPSAFAAHGDLLFVAEYRGARIVVLDAADRIVTFLGANEPAVELPGWPNRKDAAGESIRPPDLTPGKLNSPHGIAADATGNVYVAEWLIGGRYIKLEPVQT